MVAPHAALQGGTALSRRGECLATTLWLQLTAALIAPAILLHSWAGTGGTRGAGDGGMRGGADKPGRLAALLRAFGQWVEEQPVQMGAFLSMMAWLALRTAVALLVPT